MEHGKLGKWRFIYPIGKEMNAEQWVVLCRKEVEVKRIRTLWHSLKKETNYRAKVYEIQECTAWSLCNKAVCILYVRGYFPFLAEWTTLNAHLWGEEGACYLWNQVDKLARVDKCSSFLIWPLTTPSTAQFIRTL